MQFSQIKQMYVWTHKTSAVRNISVVQPSRTHCDAASQETSNCSFNTKLCGFCLINVFQILFWHKYMLTFFKKKKQNKNKTSTLNLKSYHYLPSNSQYSEMLSEAFLPWFLPTPYWFAISPSQFDI